MARRRADAERTLLCSVKFWSGAGVPTSPFFGIRNFTLRAGVRTVARAQGFGPGELDRAERALIRKGLLRRSAPGGAAVLQLTKKGFRRSCRTVRLSPWTDPQFRGAALEGSASRHRATVRALTRAARDQLDVADRQSSCFLRFGALVEASARAAVARDNLRQLSRTGRDARLRRSLELQLDRVEEALRREERPFIDDCVRRRGGRF